MGAGGRQAARDEQRKVHQAPGGERASHQAPRDEAVGDEIIEGQEAEVHGQSDIEDVECPGRGEAWTGQHRHQTEQQADEPPTMSGR